MAVHPSTPRDIESLQDILYHLPKFPLAVAASSRAKTAYVELGLDARWASGLGT
jgi:hypothetical protein